MKNINSKVMEWVAKRHKSRDKDLKDVEEEIIRMHESNSYGVFKEEEK
jgi:hypothetical protein